MIDVDVQKLEGVKIVTRQSYPSQRSSGQSKDLDEFIDLAAIALVDYNKRLGIAAGERLVIREAYPKDPVESPDIGIGLALFRVVHRQLMNTSNTGTRRTWRPREREEIQHPTDPSLKLTVLALEMDNVVEFKIVSPHAKRANELALFFERFMMAYAWYFKDMGIAQLYYQERMEDTIEVIGGSELHVRPIRYYVRTQIVSQEVARKIDEVLVQYDTGSLLNTRVLNEQYGIEESSIDHAGSNS